MLFIDTREPKARIEEITSRISFPKYEFKKLDEGDYRIEENFEFMGRKISNLAIIERKTVYDLLQHRDVQAKRSLKYNLDRINNILIIEGEFDIHNETLITKGKQRYCFSQTAFLQYVIHLQTFGTVVLFSKDLEETLSIVRILYNRRYAAGRKKSAPIYELIKMFPGVNQETYLYLQEKYKTPMEAIQNCHEWCKFDDKW